MGAPAMSMLDAIERECEKQLSMASTLQQTPDEHTYLPSTPHDVNNEVEEAAMDPYESTAVNGYNWLSYRENNIELLEAHPTSSYEYLR
jgi:hypothetical protein